MSRHHRPRPLLAIALLLLGSAGAAAIWTLLALSWNTQAAWLSLLVALDVMLLLRMARVPRGLGRGLLAVAGTALGIALANWWIAGAQIGRMFGFLPWEAIPRTGLHYAWTLSNMANGPVELAWYALALVIAALAARFP